MISNLILININRTALGCNTPIYVFGWSLDAVANIVDDTDSNPDVFTDASDND